MTTKANSPGKLLPFAAPRDARADDLRRALATESRTLGFQTKFGYRWSKFKQACWEEHQRQNAARRSTRADDD